MGAPPRWARSPETLLTYIRAHCLEDNEKGCWEWYGHRNEKGYGIIGLGGRPRRVHRVVYEIVVGSIPVGLLVRHTCDNPQCCSPEHLVVGTQADNSEDMVRRQRHKPVSFPGETHPMSRLSAAQVIAIRQDDRKQSVVAAEYGITQAAVSGIKLRKTWKHIP